MAVDTSQGWGQGASNNSKGWGQGASNNSKDWGKIHAETLGHPATNLVGGDPDAIAFFTAAEADGATVENKDCYSDEVKRFKDAGVYDSATIFNYPSAYKAGTMYAWDAVGEALVPLGFTRAGNTATRVNSAGLVESIAANVPRLDYSSGGCGKWLLEPLATNEIGRNQQFTSGSGWVVLGGLGVGVDITDNAVIAPDGTMTAARMELNSSGSPFGLRWQGLDNLTQYASSIWVKSRTTSSIMLDISDNNITTFVLTAQWQKVSMTASTKSGGAGDAYVDYVFSTASVAGDEIDIWCPQAEKGAYATSTIITTGTPETRNADVVSQGGLASLIGDSAGTIYLKSALVSYNTLAAVSLNVGNYNDSVTFEFRSTNDFRVRIRKGSANLVQTATAGSWSIGTPTALCLKYSAAGYNLVQDGSSIISGVTAVTFPDTTLNTYSNNRGDGNGHLTALAEGWHVWDIALTDDQMEAIT